ncbi:hypothetical protein TPHA_0I00230 [Tetrapisispora phaffii CBS 4417]|uniref:Transcription initiation factor TFIID subunit 8 n=1 Tax=Tetrapisispora phaffii (strain ATCC 24235 / CBS 4417 / NBRC 1672 / NRRL Y-8282 / UCD 70-5) TaxID=1071381 RepID=G8BXA2_TETPH|nr:hypothetical protein TPHA_0I00230 [Tetrapisispora phaffii CBS 4417]CCE64530.1 hypothetical protein TPHA_0I00230 [Tetrapisispora phaffii CBS 4417]
MTAMVTNETIRTSDLLQGSDGDKAVEKFEHQDIGMDKEVTEQKKYVQLTKLPTLTEFKYEDTKGPMEVILAKAIALQLKLMNRDTTITKFAFTHLTSLVDEQLSDMVNQMEKLAALQRRKEVAKKDIDLWLRGFNLQPSDLTITHQQSEYIKEKYGGEVTLLNRLATDTNEVLTVFKKTDKTLKDDSTLETLKLVPITNTLENIIPDWLPSFPPDYTYKFTPQFNKHITDATVIRKKVAAEGKKSEKALLHLLESEKITTSKLLNLDKFDSDDMDTAKLEMDALYSGGSCDRKKRTAFFEDEEDRMVDEHGNSTSNKFDIEKYVHKRINIVRNKVKQYEDKQLRLQNDPFLKMTALLSEQTDKKVSREVINTNIENVLKRSFLQLINSIPTLNQNKKDTRERAMVEKKRRHDEWLKRREEKLKKLEQEKNLRAQAFGAIDLSSFTNIDDGGFLDGFDSSENEQELEIRAKSSQNNSKDISSTGPGSWDKEEANPVAIGTSVNTKSLEIKTSGQTNQNMEPVLSNEIESVTSEGLEVEKLEVQEDQMQGETDVVHTTGEEVIQEIKQSETPINFPTMATTTITTTETNISTTETTTITETTPNINSGLEESNDTN